jgi:uncharacterized protein YbbC (DUF1343 family)
LLYPGIAMLEAASNYSVGRGTDAPFEQIGADWIDGRQLAKALNANFIPGVRVYPTRFQPTASHFEGKMIEGVRFVITDREAFDSVRLGLEVAVALEKLYPGKLDLESCKWLIGNKDTFGKIKVAFDAERLNTSLMESLQQYLNRRSLYLLY